MPKKGKKLSVLSDADEAQLKKLSRKERAQASYGKPDDSDIRNLTALFDLYEKSHPGRLRRMYDSYQVEKGLKDPTSRVAARSAIKSDQFEMAFWLPRDLQEFMEQYYPTLWTNKEHARWFVSKFPMFKA